MEDLKYLTEAFQDLNILNEDTFDINADGLAELTSFYNDNNDMADLETVIDPVAQTEEELQDSYIGKAILDCVICQSKIYKDPEEVIISEDGSLANVGEICPYCQSSDGYKVIGQVAEYCPHCDDEDVKVETDEAEITVDVDKKEDEELEESIKNKDNNQIKTLLDQALNFNKTQHKTGNKKFQNISIPSTNGTNAYILNSIKQWAKDNNINLCEVRASDLNDTDLGGYISNGSKITSTEFDKLNNPNSVLFLDEYDRVPRSARADLLKLINDHTISDPREESGQRYLPNFLFTIVTINSADGLDMPELVRFKPIHEGVLDRNKNDSLKEDMQNISIETDKEKINISSESKEEEEVESDDEMIAPLEPETEEEFKSENEEDEYSDVDIDEFEEKDFDELGEKYLRRVYENVKSYKTTKGSTQGNILKLEGVITFKSGKEAKTNFVFEAKSITKTGKLKFLGENKQFARGKQAFTLTGRADGKKLIAESLTYNYRAKNPETKESKRLYGTVSSSKLR